MSFFCTFLPHFAPLNLLNGDGGQEEALSATGGRRGLKDDSATTVVVGEIRSRACIFTIASEWAAVRAEVYGTPTAFLHVAPYANVREEASVTRASNRNTLVFGYYGRL